MSSTEDDRVLLRSVTELAVTGPSTDAGGDGEFEVIADEFKKGCCKERCYEQFSPPEILDFKLSMRELTKGERDLILMGKLQVVTRDPATISHARAKKPTKRRLTCEYMFDHRCVCQKALCFIHEIGDFTLRSLRKHISENGPIPREHGSKGCKAHNAYPFSVVSSAIEFVKNYALVFGYSALKLLQTEVTRL